MDQSSLLERNVTENVLLENLEENFPALISKDGNCNTITKIITANNNHHDAVDVENIEKNDKFIPTNDCRLTEHQLQDTTRKEADNRLIMPNIYYSEPLTVNPIRASTGLDLLASQYDYSENETDSDNNSDNFSITKPFVTDNIYRTSKVIEIHSDSESEVEILDAEQRLQKLVNVDILDCEDETSGINNGPLRVKGEMILDDLPPIQDLIVTVPESKCVEYGKIHSIVEQLVLVDSLPGAAPLNLDTILFLDKGQKALGEVFDVLGQVNSPLYCVRFNSNKQIKERGFEVGQKVYIAPQTEHTHFVILPEMLKLRGSDASWENDIEPAEKHLDYSDDEEERSAKRAQRNRNCCNEESSNRRQRSVPSASVTYFQPTSYQQQTGHHRTSEHNVGFYQHQHSNPQFSGFGNFPHQVPYEFLSRNWHTNYTQDSVIRPHNSNRMFDVSLMSLDPTRQTFYPFPPSQ